MSGMKRVACSLTFLAIVAFAAAPRAAAQAGSIEFVARATPSGGLDELVRGFPFFLLSKSFASIEKDVVATYPMPDVDAFIDKLTVSKELKVWMKKNHSVKLSGEDFIKKLHAAEIMDIPEFYAAYMSRNAGDDSMNFPKPKANPADKVKNPAKYEKLTKEYNDAVRHFIELNPDTIDGIDLGLTAVDPGPKWDALVAKRAPEINRQVRELAQSKYLVARAETDLQGQGFLHGIPPGTYWLSTLDVAANIGDARPRWDLEVTVRPGETNYVTLSSVNAIQPPPRTLQ
jgi:hypothetical protein